MNVPPHRMMCIWLPFGMTCRAAASAMREAAERLLCNSESRADDAAEERKDESCSRHSGEE